MDALLKKICGFHPFRRKNGKDGAWNFFAIEESIPTQAELGWGTRFVRIEAAQNAGPFIRP
jgi:hypothetical protein